VGDDPPFRDGRSGKPPARAPIISWAGPQVIGFGISPLLAVHGGKTSDPAQLKLEILLTVGSGVLAILGFILYGRTKIARNIQTAQAPSPVGGMCAICMPSAASMQPLPPASTEH
jgi:hypothetical protein